MRFGKYMGTLGVIVGHLFEVWEVYGDPRLVIMGLKNVGSTFQRIQ